MTEMDGPEVVVVDASGNVVGEESGGGLSELVLEYLTDKEIKAGGGTRDDGFSRWWLDLDQLAEFEKRSVEITDDNDFWAWFSDFRKVAKLRKEGRGQNTGFMSKAKDWGKGWFSDKPQQTSKGYLSDVWGGYGYKSGWYSGSGGSQSGVSEKARELHVALGIIRSTVSSIRTTVGRYHVEFASDTPTQPTSFTDLHDQLVVVSPQALMDKSNDEATGIEITSGFALHEASHVEHTDSIKKAVDGLMPASIAAPLLNIIEDARIERITADRFPGFAPFFDTMLAYLWKIGETARKNVGGRIEFHNTSDLQSKFGFIVLAVRWPKEWTPDAGDQAEFDWWNGWRDRYLAEPTVTTPLARKYVEEGLERLKQTSATQMANRTKEEQRLQAAGQALADIIAGMLDEARKQGKVPQSCSGPGGALTDKATGGGGRGSKGMAVVPKEAKVGNALSKEITQIGDQQMQWDKTPLVQNSVAGDVEVVVSKPVETPVSQREFSNQRSPIFARLKHAFVFRPQTPSYTERGLRSGRLDAGALHRFANRDYRMFERKTEEIKPNTDITLLIDQSGSMGGYGEVIAQRLAQVMLSVLKDAPGVQVKVRSHSASPCQILRIWEKGDPITRLGFSKAHFGNGGNADGYAIGWCIKELLAGKPETQKLLIVLADGQPSVHPYGGRYDAEQYVRAVTDEGERRGVKTIQLAINSHMDARAQAVMFKRYVMFESDEKLPQQLTKILTDAL